MSLRKPEHGDENNAAFETAEVPLDHSKSGLKHDAPAAGSAEDAEGHHRFARSDAKDIPQQSLAARVRNAAKGG
jgi:hypothetical protein